MCSMEFVENAIARCNRPARRWKGSSAAQNFDKEEKKEDEEKIVARDLEDLMPRFPRASLYWEWASMVSYLYPGKLRAARYLLRLQSSSILTCESPVEHPHLTTRLLENLEPAICHHGVGCRYRADEQAPEEPGPTITERKWTTSTYLCRTNIQVTFSKRR